MGKQNQFVKAESHNDLGWKGPLDVIKWASVKGEQVTQSLAQLSFEHLHKWSLQTKLDILFWYVTILTVNIYFLWQSVIPHAAMFPSWLCISVKGLDLSSL